MSRLALSLAGLAFAAGAAHADPPRKMNVLFIAVDDLKPALACAGDPHARTPNIDKLAAHGTVFNRAYCQQAVCSPSRSSLLTGRRPDTTKVYDLVTHFRDALPDVVTLPQHFKNNGYYTHGVGKIYHPGYNDEPTWSVPWEGTKGRNFGPGGQKLLGELKAKAPGQDRSKVRGLPVEAPEVADESLNDGWTASRAIEILESRKAEEGPFFLAVGFLKPHLPFVAPKAYWDLYDPAKLPVAESADPPQDAPRFAPQFGGELRAYHDIPKSGPLPAETARELVHGYYAALSYMDAQVGRVLDALEDRGLADRTVVILWGDHGWHLGDHGMWCKHTNYERATRAALVMSVPGQKGPAARPTPWSNSSTSTRRWPPSAGCRNPRAWRGTASPRCWTTRRGRGRPPPSASTRAAARTPARSWDTRSAPTGTATSSGGRGTVSRWWPVNCTTTGPTRTRA